jgi:UMP-CMP kinase
MSCFGCFQRKPSKRIVFVLGGPGSGKGTQCAKLVEKFGYTHISAGDLLRAEVKAGGPTADQINQLMKEGNIVPAEIIVALLKKAIDASDSDTVLVDGFPRALDQVGLFNKVSRTDCAFVLFFDCNDEVLTARLLERGKTSGRADDNLESIKKRFVTFREQSYPVVELYEKKSKDKVKRVDSSVGTAAEVFVKVEALFSPRATPRAAL